MGSMPTDIFLHHILSTSPASINWTEPRRVVIWKGNRTSLGLKIEVFQEIEFAESYAIVTKVKNECHLKHGDHLQIYDRIIKINDQDITSFNKDNVLNFISLCKRFYCIVLHVCSPSKGTGKRTADQLSDSNSSLKSGEGMGKVKGDKNKRLAKSNSVDSSDKKEPSENDALLSTDGPHSPDSNPCFTCGIGAVADSERTQSLPLSKNLDRLQLEEDRINSLPNSRYPCPFAVGNGQGMCIHGCVYCNNNRIFPNEGNMSSRSGSGLPRLDCKLWKQLQVGGPSVVLKFPHLVKWDPNTKVVTLHRGTKGNFGFTFKVKAAKNADDLFTLVESVCQDGPATGHLMVGDWIRSVNGRPLQTPKEALGITNLIKEASEVRIVLQRPDLDEMPLQNIAGASPLWSPELQVLNEAVPCFEPAVNTKSPESVDSGYTVSSLTNRPHSAKKTYDRQNSASSQKSLISKRGSSESAKQYFNPDLFTVVKSAETSDSVIDTVIDETAVEPVHIQVMVSDRQSPHSEQLSRTVSLPKVRVFICGSEANSLSRVILPGALLPSDISNKKYSCVKCTMGMDRQGKISFTPWSAFDHLLQDCDMTSLHASSDSLAQLVREQEDSATFLHKGFVNMEFFIVPDEKFFHHCCQYLFTRTSLFLLTFNGDKMINSAAGEISKLENMIHTIRCFVGYECQILTYGLVGVDQTDPASSVTVDEVITLFYTSYGNQIQKHSVSMPFIFNASADQNAGYADDCRQLHNNIWKIVSDTVQKQHVVVASLAILQQLELYKRKGQTVITEDEFRNIFKFVVPGGEQDLQQMVSVELKDYGVILSSKTAPLPRSGSQCLDKLLFIEPEILLASIQHLILVPPELIKTNEGIKQKYFRLIDTGIISQEDMISLCSHAVNGMDKINELLEIYGLVFRQEVEQEGQGQFNYFVPYFIQEQTIVDGPKLELSDLCLYIQFTTHMAKHISSMQFYQLAFCMNSACSGKDLVIHGSACGVLHQHGYKVTLFHQKLYDRIQIILSRTEQACKPSQILHWLSGLCRSTFGSEKYVLGPACPLQEKCNIFSKNGTDIHILDVSRGEHVKCGDARIDNHKLVRIWTENTQTFLDPAQAVPKTRPLDRSETGSNASLKSENVPPPQVYVTDLPYTIFHKICLYLQIESIHGRDWKYLAGKLGMSMDDILLYETQKNQAAQQLLLDLGRSHKLTIDGLVEILSQPDMERQDIIDIIRDM